MRWKQSKRRSPLFLNKTRFWLSFLLEIPLFSKPGTSERASFTRQETLRKKRKGLESKHWFPRSFHGTCVCFSAVLGESSMCGGQGVAPQSSTACFQIPALPLLSCVNLGKLLNLSGLWANSCYKILSTSHRVVMRIKSANTQRMLE